jgi:predicted enzyme related to lactoylglutathione lyase
MVASAAEEEPMTTRDRAPRGAPSWADLWTSDVDSSRAFYSELFGWEALEADPQFGGYFMFTHNGAPVAGGMGDMGDMKAENIWQIYLQTDDAESTLERVQRLGGTVVSPAMPVADLGTQAILTDATGAHLGLWQPGTFGGFSTLTEHGTPSWFELATSDYAKAVAFYEEAFGWTTSSISDTDEFRYTVMTDPDGGPELAGIMDASGFLGEESSNWSVYWHVDDAVATARTAEKLGGSIVQETNETPYGVLAELADPSGARFRIRALPAG